MSVYIMLILSVILTLSSNSWLLIWILLEFNSMAFLMLMLNEKLKANSNTSMKYFLIQSIGSIMILIYFGFFSSLNNFSLMIMKMGLIIMILALFLKMAMAPFHTWIIKVMKNLNFLLLMVLLLWQKVIPIFLSMNINKNLFMMIISMLAIVIGSLSQFNISSVLIIMIMSSIVHLSWMMISSGFIYLNPFIYLSFYFLMTMLIFNLLYKYNMKFLWNQMSKKFFSKFSLMIYSLAGLPPLLGFIPKWIIMITLLNFKLILIMLIYMLMTGLNFYVYNRLLYSINMMSFMKMKTDSNLFSFNKFSLNFIFPLLLIYF